MNTVTLFTGHRVDAPDRSAPRFPAALAAAAQDAIAAHLKPGRAVSSASNGGDILFLEACRAKGVPADIFLPMSPARFRETSVRTNAAGDWEARFDALWAETPTERRHVLSPASGSNTYANCNAALLAFARVLPGPHKLIALWDGAKGDGPGGTEDLVTKARAAGFDIIVIDPAQL